MTEELISLYAEVAALTKSGCMARQEDCSLMSHSKYNCCEKKFCDMARDFALSCGVELKPTGHPSVPFMGAEGCTVPPHLRPTCSVHACSIAYAKASHIEHDEQKTARYFELIGRIENEKRKATNGIAVCSAGVK